MSGTQGPRTQLRQRIHAALDDLDQVPTSWRAASHEPGCWRRHVECLAQRIRIRLHGDPHHVLTTTTEGAPDA